MSISYQKLEAIAEDYDAFLIDQFGVLLDGKDAYPQAPETLNYLAATHKPIILLSNSGKRSGPNIKRLLDLGFSRSSFETVLSSGEVAFLHLQIVLGARFSHAAKVFLLSRDGDKTAIDDLDIIEVDHANEADLLFITGIDPWKLTLNDYEELLEPFIAKKIPAICSNPDQIMLTSKGPTMAAGKVAKRYEEMGGQVKWIGKPYPMVYEQALKLLPNIMPSRILCIGDSPEHDIMGGQNAGLATALVRTGIHADMSDQEIENLCSEIGARPNAFLKSFQLSGGK